MPSIPPPRLPYPVTLNFRGDWGLANFHRILSWLCHTFCENAPGSRVAIWNGVGGVDNVDAVANGHVQLAITTPASYVAGALTGEGLFAGRPAPALRALAVLPQDDAMIFAVAKSFGARTLADLHALRPPLRIAVPPDDGDLLFGYIGHRILEAAGLDRATVESWGGAYIETRVRPGDCIALVTNGEADAVVHEAMMIPAWAEAARVCPLAYLDLDEAVLATLEATPGWRRRVVPADQFEGQEKPLVTLDFSDFLVVVRDDLNDDVAQLLTWCLVETRHLIEQQYRHIPPRRSPLTYPLIPERMAATPIPLHRGAKAYFRSVKLV